MKPASTALRRLLLAWLLVWLLVFCIPSIRSARYVIPAMPALALALALAWERIGRAWFVASLAAAALCLLVLGRLAWVMAELGIADGPIAGLAALVFGLGAVSIGWALVRPAATRHAALAASLLVFASFNATVAALDGPAGHFDAQAVRTVYGLRVAVPSDFNAAFERYEFALPGNHIVPYPALATLPAPSASLAPASSARDANLAALLAQADAVVWATPAQAPDPCASGGCQVLARRWVVQSRQPPGAITLAALWAPQRWLLQREWLLARGP